MKFLYMYVKQIVGKDDSYITNLNHSSFTRISFTTINFRILLDILKSIFKRDMPP